MMLVVGFEFGGRGNNGTGVAGWLDRRQPMSAECLTISLLLMSMPAVRGWPQPRRRRLAVEAVDPGAARGGHWRHAGAGDLPDRRADRGGLLQGEWNTDN